MAPNPSPRTPPSGEASPARKVHVNSPRGQVRDAADEGTASESPGKKPRLPKPLGVDALRAMQVLCEEDDELIAAETPEEPSITVVKKAKQEHLQMLHDRWLPQQTGTL